MTNETKLACGKCYKLNRIDDVCERYQQTVKRTALLTWEKCEKCITAQKEKENGKRF